MSNTMTLSFTLGDFALFIIAIAVIVLVFAIAKALNKLGGTCERVNQLIDGNKKQLDEILKNGANLTKKSDDLVTQTTDTVTPILEFLGTIAKVLPKIGKKKPVKKKN